MDWLVNAVYYVVPFVVLLGILVFVHEYGHFWVARRLGVQVEAFSIGFGKTLWSKTDSKGTTWKISAIPLGGYCQFLGDADASSSTTEEQVVELTDEQKKVAFAFQNPFKKLAIAVAGPAANYLYAIVVFAMVFYFVGKITFPPIVGDVLENSAAAKAGIVPQDRILSINGNEIKYFEDIRKEVDLITDKKATVVLKRGEQVLTLTFPLQEIEVKEYDGNVSKRPMLGVKSVNSVEIEKEKMSFVGSWREAVLKTWNITEATLRGVGQMITGRRSSEDLGGIVRIAEMSGDISKSSGFVDFVIFMSLLSINLGLINLFPIPVLDGGHVVIYLIEIVTGKELNDKVKEYLFRFGFSFIVLLMVYATWNDVVHLFHRWFA